MSSLDQIILGFIIAVSAIFVMSFIGYLSEKLTNKDVRGGIISRFFIRRLRKRLSIQCQVLSWYIGVERNGDPDLLDKYERNEKLLRDLDYFIEKGL